MGVFLPVTLHGVARSFVVQALVALATIALLSASSSVATVDAAASATPAAAPSAR